jgi:hypothetical protein
VPTGGYSLPAGGYNPGHDGYCGTPPGGHYQPPPPPPPHSVGCG